MIKKLAKSTKGVTLIALAITIVVIMIVTSIILANLQGNLKIQKLQKLQTDIDNLREAISAYYMQYGKIPAKCKYKVNSSKIDSIGPIDTAEKFLVIDLSAIDNLTLNYGKDYEKVKELSEFKSSSELNDTQIAQYTDLYIINEESHNIFYVQGIEIDGDMYYTDYTAEEKDKENFNLANPPTTISDVKTRGYNFWATTQYTIGDDSNKITIPAGFKIADDSPTNVSEGIVIEDVSSSSTFGSQFVWIPCTVEQYKAAKDAVMTENWSSDSGYKNNGNKNVNMEEGKLGDGLAWIDDYTDTDIENVKKAYGSTAETTIGEITSKLEKNQTKVAEESIKKYGGFYIARYEAGIPNDTVGSETNKVETNKAGLDKIANLLPVSKKGVQAWNYITQPNAKIVSENMYKTSSSVGSYLVDSQAWNHICKNIFGKNTGKSITDSTNWGNYSNNGSENKQKLTGSSENFKNYNIYDMAGNMWEWTTGHNSNSNSGTMFVVGRGRWLRS